MKSVLPRRTVAPRPVLATIGLLSLAATLAGCEDHEEPAPAALVTLATLQGAWDQGETMNFGAGLDQVFSKGFPPVYFLRGRSEIRLAPAYTEGTASAYMTTDIWVNFPLVWAQPMYVFVKAWDAGPAGAHVLAGVPPVFSVGPKSAFYSPFWRVYYVVVDPATPPDRYRTVKQILDAELPLFPGPGKLATFVPAGLVPQADSDGFQLPGLRPVPGPDGSPQPRISTPKRKQGWIDGVATPVDFLDFGNDRFEWNDRYEVAEAPLFFFFLKDPSGAWVPVTNVPRVGGTGPVGANRPAVAPGNKPAFGSLWRLWAARLPPTARIFVPPDRLGEWEAAERERPAWSPSLPVAGPLPPAIADRKDLDQHAFKVLRDTSCLAPDKTFPDDCSWLDSQAAVERLLPSAIEPSQILVHCPYLAYEGKPVPIE